MAELKNTTIDDTGFIKLPVGLTAQRPTPSAGQIRLNTDTAKIEQYNAGLSEWIGTAPAGVVATGGTVYDVDTEGTTYRVHVFTNTGNSSFTVSKGGEVEYLIVAGGGSGGNCQTNSGLAGSGGGAGGTILGTTSVTPQSYTVTVGAGGAATNSNTVQGGDGSNSSAFGLIALGGGAGGGDNGNYRCSTGSSASQRRRGCPGGCGGGSGDTAPGGAATQPGSASGGFGNAGGSGSGGGFAGGGGGGGGPGNSNGIGGIGINSAISGTSLFYAGGGSAGGNSSVPGAVGTFGGGGRGINYREGTIIEAANGTPNTGGGGGGTPANQGVTLFSGAGGSGIVIIRYPLRQENPVASDGKVTGDGVVLDLDFAKPTVYNGSGNIVYDSRGNLFQGTISGPDYINPRSHRSAFSFDGGSDTIAIPAENAIMTTNGSLLFWLYADPTGSSYEGIIDSDFYGGTPGGWRFYRFDSVDIRMWESGNPVVYISNAITENAWQHLALVRDGTAVKIYKNGGQIGTGTSTYAQWDGTLITLGSQWTGSSARLNGDLAVVKMYDRAVSATEVLTDYNTTRWRFGI